MPIKRGDKLIIIQEGIEQPCEALTDVDDEGMVQVKSKGCFMPCPAKDLYDTWVLCDPSGKDLETEGAIYVQPDGQTTTDKDKAKLFKNSDDAERFRDGFSGIPNFEPKKLKDCP